MVWQIAQCVPILSVFCPCSVVVVQFEESRVNVNESAGAVEVCLLKEGVTAQNITVSVIAQELAAGNSASGRCVFTISVHCS